MEVTEDVAKNQPEKEKINDDPGTHQEIAEPVTPAEYSEVQAQSACNGKNLFKFSLS